jgi:N-acetyl-gamma-glutamyl-phosphate reductase uncommon form
VKFNFRYFSGAPKIAACFYLLLASHRSIPPMSSPLVFIDGDRGTTGLQIHERLRDRTDLTVITLPAAERKDSTRRAEAINACDIAILCLPDAAAREAVGAIVNPAVRVIDASSAHRTQSDWTYGFPEMTPGQAERIANARRVTPVAIRQVQLACCASCCRLG